MAIISQKITWRFDVLPLATKRALEYLSKQTWLKRSSWYLAGGTALALQTGHRSSVDLDFFTPQSNFLAGRLLEHFKNNFWKTDILREGTVYGRLLGAKASFIAYPFFIAKYQFHNYGAIRVLNQRDIAAMKIVAISQRGRKRDFIDLYWYCINREPLSVVLRRLRQHYPQVSHNYNHIIKSLVYFKDAEDDPMPEIFFRTTWSEIKKFFQREVVKLSKEFLLLE